MLNLHSQTVTVDRLALIEALREGRHQHVKAWEEANADFKKAVEQYLTDALYRVKNGVFKDYRCALQAPVCHEQEYLDVIEMLEVSVDEKITLDREAFKAYYKNQWSWSKGFLEASALYKSAIGARN